MTTTYEGWRQVPGHLLTATQLGELEFPRTPTDKPHAHVETYDWRDKKDTVPLYNVHRCPPTKATGPQLAAAAARSTRSRVCADCGAHCQRILPEVGGRPLCPVCRGVVLLRDAQEKIAAARIETVAGVREKLARPNLAIVQTTIHNPGRTPAGSARPDNAVRVWAVDGDGHALVDVLVSLVGPKSKFALPDAVPREEGAAAVHAALIGRSLIAWDEGELLPLVEHLNHPDWPRERFTWDLDRVATVRAASTVWRGQLDERRKPVPSIPPGTPDRLLLHLQRIAADEPAADAGGAA